MAVGGCDVLTDGVSAETVHPAFALFEVDGVRREVPVHHRMAPPMEVDSLLPDACRCENEWPERTVERVADLRSANALGVFGRCAVPQREAHGDWDLRKVSIAGPRVIAGRAKCQGFDRAIGDLTDCADIDTRSAELEFELEAVLVEHSLQVAVSAIPEH